MRVTHKTGHYAKKLTAFTVISAIISLGGAPNISTRIQVANGQTPPSRWVEVVSDSELDFGYLDLYVSVVPDYFERTLDFDLLVPAQMTRDLPPDFELADPQLVARYDPDFLRGYASELHFARFMRFYSAQNPNALIATYMSGTDCYYADMYYPASGVDCRNLPADRLLFNTFDDPQRFLVDFSDPITSHLVAELIVNEAQARGYPILYLDNIAHPHTLYYETTAIDSTSIINHLAYLKTQLNDHGIGLVVNIAVIPAFLAAHDTQLDAEQLARVVDGLSFETPFSPSGVRTRFDLVLDTISVMRYWLANDKLLLWVPQITDADGVASITNRLKDRLIVAAFIVLIREPGDAIRLDRWYWLEENYFPWRDWPAAFGAPRTTLAVASQPNGWQLDRTYANGRIRLQHVTLPTGTSLKFHLQNGDNWAGFTIADPPENGTLDIANLPEVTYTPYAGRIGVDAFMLENTTGTSTDRVVVGIYVSRANESCLLTSSHRVNRHVDPNPASDVLNTMQPGSHYTAINKTVSTDSAIWYQLVTSEWVPSDAVEEVTACQGLLFVE